MKMNMKKINSKGFTLIELLAIIVILAVILVVAVPQMLDVMDSSKTRSLHNSAKSVASGWNNNNAAAQLENKVYAMSLDGKWRCIDNDAASTLGLSTNDYIIIDGDEGKTEGITADSADPNCSMAHINTAGAVEVILVAKSGGSLYLAGANERSETDKFTNMWAKSDGTHSWKD